YIRPGFFPDRRQFRNCRLARRMAPRASFEAGFFHQTFTAPHLRQFVERVQLTFEPMSSGPIRFETKRPLFRCRAELGPMRCPDSKDDFCHCRVRPLDPSEVYTGHENRERKSNCPRVMSSSWITIGKGMWPSLFARAFRIPEHLLHGYS